METRLRRKNDFQLGRAAMAMLPRSRGRRCAGEARQAVMQDSAQGRCPGGPCARAMPAAMAPAGDWRAFGSGVDLIGPVFAPQPSRTEKGESVMDVRRNLDLDIEEIRRIEMELFTKGDEV